jgi:hypothetical protein
MKKIARLIFSLALPLFLVPTGFLEAREPINAGGTATQGSGVSCSFRVSQEFYEAWGDGVNGLTEGVQHPFEVYVFSLSPPDMGIVINHFSNLTSGALHLLVRRRSDVPLSYALIDLHSCPLFQTLLANQPMHQDIAEHPGGSYLLQITTDNRLIESAIITKYQ